MRRDLETHRADSILGSGHRSRTGVIADSIGLARGLGVKKTVVDRAAANQGSNEAAEVRSRGHVTRRVGIVNRSRKFSDQAADAGEVPAAGGGGGGDTGGGDTGGGDTGGGGGTPSSAATFSSTGATLFVCLLSLLIMLMN